MTEAARIAQQLENAFSGGAWHGPALLELLADVDATTAAAHPVPGAHSIWELVLHIGPGTMPSPAVSFSAKPCS
jgi:hypothetical protein